MPVFQYRIGAWLEHIRPDEAASLKRLWEERAFDRYLELSRAKGPGTVSQIYDKDGNVLSRTTGVKTC